MTLFDIMNSWLYEKSTIGECDWIAHRISSRNIIALKPRMIAMPYPIYVLEKRIKFCNYDSYDDIWHSMKIDVNSPEFFNILLTLIKNRRRVKHTCSHECGSIL